LLAPLPAPRRHYSTKDDLWGHFLRSGAYEGRAFRFTCPYDPLAQAGGVDTSGTGLADQANGGRQGGADAVAAQEAQQAADQAAAAAAHAASGQQAAAGGAQR
jgi:hypothetical protein